MIAWTKYIWRTICHMSQKTGTIPVFRGCVHILASLTGVLAQICEWEVWQSYICPVCSRCRTTVALTQHRIKVDVMFSYKFLITCPQSCFSWEVSLAKRDTAVDSLHQLLYYQQHRIQQGPLYSLGSSPILSFSNPFLCTLLRWNPQVHSDSWLVLN